MTHDHVHVYRVLGHSQDTLTSQKNVLQLAFLLRNLLAKKRTASRPVSLRVYSQDDLLRFPRYWQYRMAVERVLAKVRLPSCLLCLKTSCSLETCLYRWRCSHCRLYGHTRQTCTLQAQGTLLANQHFRQQDLVTEKELQCLSCLGRGHANCHPMQRRDRIFCRPKRRHYR